MQYFISDDRMIEFVVTEDITKEFGLHNHTGHYVISFITKGKATVFYNNVSVVLAKGDTFIIRPYMPHSVAVESGSQILSMCIKKDLFSAQSFGEISQTVSTKFDEIAAETSLETGIKSELNDAVRLIAETIGDERYKLSADIQQIADKIAEKSSKIYSLDQLSEDVYISKYHLIRKFKSKIGLTPHQFMIQVSVRNAQKEPDDGGRLRRKSVAVLVARGLRYVQSQVAAARSPDLHILYAQPRDADHQRVQVRVPRHRKH
jgi:AraC-like DNA-binding protein